MVSLVVNNAMAVMAKRKDICPAQISPQSEPHTQQRSKASPTGGCNRVLRLSTPEVVAQLLNEVLTPFCAYN